MSGFLLIMVGLVYLGLSISYFVNGNAGLGIAFVFYSIANYGLYLAGKV